MALKIIWNDICAEQADAIVTLVCPLPRIGPGLDAVIHAAAGPDLLADRKRFGIMEPGMVRVSSSHSLVRATKAKWIIHTMGPVCGADAGTQEELMLEACYLRVLFKSVELGCKVVAMPVFSSGKFGMPVERALSVAVRVITEFLKACPSLEVKLVSIDPVFRNCAKRSYRGCFCEGRSAAEAAKRIKKMSDLRAPEVDEITKALADKCDRELRSDSYFSRYKDAATAREAYGKPFHELIKIFTQKFYASERKAKEANANRRRGESREYVTDAQALADATGISLPAIRKMNGEGAHTSRDKIFAMAVVMGLSPDDVKALLAAGEHKRIKPPGKGGKMGKSRGEGGEIEGTPGALADEEKKRDREKRVQGRKMSKAERERQAARDKVVFDYLMSDERRFGVGYLNTKLAERGMKSLDVSAKRHGRKDKARKDR